MSTKIFSSQISWGYLVAKSVQGQFSAGKKNLEKTSSSIRNYLKKEANISQLKKITEILSTKKDIFLLGKFQNFAIMNEGMVKMIEGTYLHAHSIPAGDLKHYAITLMEKGVLVIIAVSDDIVKNDAITSINEVRLRGAKIIAIAHKKESNYDFYIQIDDLNETDALGNIVPLQLLAYFMATKLDNDVDKPRNIAKSVTVK